MNSCISYKRSAYAFLAVLVSCFAHAPFAAAAEAGDPAVAVAPFINNFTFGVIRLQVPDTDFDAMGHWVDEMLARFQMTEADRRQASQELHGSLAAVHRSADAFTKAGGKTL